MFKLIASFMAAVMACLFLTTPAFAHAAPVQSKPLVLKVSNQQVAYLVAQVTDAHGQVLKNPDHIRPGQLIFVRNVSYIVKRGDTVWGVVHNHLEAKLPVQTAKVTALARVTKVSATIKIRTAHSAKPVVITEAKNENAKPIISSVSATTQTPAATPAISEEENLLSNIPTARLTIEQLVLKKPPTQEPVSTEALASPPVPAPQPAPPPTRVEEAASSPPQKVPPPKIRWSDLPPLPDL